MYLGSTLSSSTYSMWIDIVESSMISVEMRLVRAFIMIGDDLCWGRSCDSEEWKLDEWCHEEGVDLDLLDYVIPDYLCKIFPKTCDIVGRLKDESYYDEALCLPMELDEAIVEIVDNMHSKLVYG